MSGSEISELDSLGDAGPLGGLPTGVPDDLAVNRMVDRMPTPTRKQPQRGLAPQPATVLSQGSEQLRAEHDIAILAAFAALDVDDHALAVDVADLEPGTLRTADPGGVDGHQQDAMQRREGGRDEPSYFPLAEDRRQANDLLGIGSFGHAPGRLERPDVEKAPCCESLNDRVGRQLPLAEQMRLILADVLGTQLVRWAVE